MKPIEEDKQITKINMTKEVSNKISEASEVLMDLRIKSAKQTVTEQDLYKVQMMLYKTLDDLAASHLSNESKALDVEGLRAKFENWYYAEDERTLLDGTEFSHGQIFDWFLSELANIKQGGGKTKPHELKEFKDKLDSFRHEIEMIKKYMGYVRKKYDHITIIKELRDKGFDNLTSEGIHKLMFYNIDGTETWQWIDGILKDKFDLMVNNFGVSPLVNTEELKEIVRENLEKLTIERWHDGHWYEEIRDKNYVTECIVDEIQAHLQPKQPVVNTTNQADEKYPTLYNTNMYDKFLPQNKLVNTLSTDEKCEYCGGDGVYIDGDNNRLKCPICPDSDSLQQGEDTKSWDELQELFYVENDANIYKWSDENRLILEYTKWLNKRFPVDSFTKSEWVSVEAVDKLNPGDIFIWKSGMNGNYEIHQFHSDAGYGAKTFTNYNETDGSSIIVNYSGICGILVPKSPTI